MTDTHTESDQRRAVSAVGPSTALARGRIGLAALIALCTLWAYLPVLTPGAGLLWDDDAELWGVRGDLVQAPDGPLRAWFPIERPEHGWLDVARWRPVHGHGFWPLTPTAFWVQWRAFGADDRWASAHDMPGRRAAVESIAYRFHWPGVLLHAVNAALVLGLMRRLAVPGAFWIAAVFALHPVQVPSVAWVSELKNTLSLCFGLVATRCFLAALERSRARLAFAAAFGAFFLSLSAKTAGVGLPVVWTLLTIRRDGGWRARRARQLAPFYLLGLAMAAITLWFTHQSGGLNAEVVSPGGFWARLALAGWVPWFYLRLTLWPFDLVMIHPTPAIEFGSLVSLLPGLALAGVGLGFAWLWRTGTRWPAIALCSALALLFPVAGFFDMTFMMHAPVSDHFFYMASVPTLALLIGGTFSVAGRSMNARRGLALAMLLATAWLAASTHARAEVFRTQIGLWRHNVAINPEAWMAQYNLGSLLEVEARGEPEGPARTALLEAALEHLSRAARLKPVYRNAPAREAAVLELLGRDEAAADAWRRALEAGVAGGRDGDERQALHARDLARTWMRLGRPERAIAPYEQAVARLPRAWRVRVELAAAYAAVHRARDARQELERVLEARPRDLEALLALAQLLLDSGDASVRDPAEARRLARRAMAAAAGDPTRRTKAELLLQRARHAARSQAPAPADSAGREAEASSEEPIAR